MKDPSCAGSATSSASARRSRSAAPAARHARGADARPARARREAARRARLRGRRALRRISGEPAVPLDGVRVVRVGAGPHRSAWKTRCERRASRDGGSCASCAASTGSRGSCASDAASCARAALGRIDVVHANDLDTLPAAYLLARERAHGSSTTRTSSTPSSTRPAAARARGWLRLEGRLAGAPTRSSPSATPIADELRRRLGVEPIVVLNAPAPRRDRAARADDGGPLRASTRAASGPAAARRPARGDPRAPSVRLTLRVSRSTRASSTRELPVATSRRVDVDDPCRPTVVTALHGYHVGLLFDRPLTRNAELSAPNKLFEYLMAGLAVVRVVPGLLWLEDERLGLLARKRADHRPSVRRPRAPPADRASSGSRPPRGGRYNARHPLRGRGAPPMSAATRPASFAPNARSDSTAPSLLLGGRGVKRELSRYSLLARTLARADVVHFNFGSSLLPRWYPPELTGPGVAHAAYAAYARLVELRDLPLLRRAGKRIFVTYQGDDIRQRAQIGPHAVPGRRLLPPSSTSSERARPPASTGTASGSTR